MLVAVNPPLKKSKPKARRNKGRARRSGAFKRFLLGSVTALIGFGNFHNAFAVDINNNIFETNAQKSQGQNGEIKTAQNTQPSITIPLKPSPAAPRPSVPKEVEIVVPLSERGAYLGDLPVTIRGETPYFDAARVAQLLKDFAAQSSLKKLSELGNGNKISVEDLKANGFDAVWDPGLLSIDIIVSAKDKNSRDIEIAELERTERGQFTQPAKFALFTNLRTSLDYQHFGVSKGLRDPFIDANLGGRIFGVAFENELTYDTGGVGFRRNASRLVFDNEKRAIRMTLGDVRPQVRGYQSSSDLLGVSLFSAYQSIQPLRNMRPRGEGSFTLNDPSNVDIVINGRVVRRLHLDSGAYNLKDFPFLDGQNRVAFVVEDRTGRRELAKFDVFFDRNLLASNLNEWAINAGQTQERGPRGPIYNNGKFYASGFYRRGLSSNLTMGGNLQLYGNSGIAGWETVWGSKVGMISWDLAQSFSKNGNGTALNLSFQRNSNNSDEGKRTSWGIAANARTINFGSNEDFKANNSEAGTISTFWSRNLNQNSSVSMDANYSFGRGATPNNWSARVGYGHRLNSRISINTDINYANNRFGKDVGFRIQLTTRFGREGNATAAYDSRDERLSLNAQRSGQSRLGNWSVNGDIDRGKNSSSINAGAFLAANRGEIGIAHSTGFDASFGNKNDERTSIRIATAFGFADGAMAWGKPVYGAFAIALPHKTLKGRTIRIDANNNASGFNDSKIFGPPLIGNIPNYTRRDLAIDVDDLPAGYDLGTGSISIRAPYNAGYKLIVGSSDNLTIIGRALNEDNEPIPFIAAKAKRASDNKEVELFTNGRGVFSATGMGPGHWEIIFNTQPEPTIINIDLSETGSALRKLGDLKGEAK